MICLHIHLQPAGIPGGIQVESSGIIAGSPPEFQWNSTGILAEFQLKFLCFSGRNSAGIIARILPCTPAGIPQEFYRNAGVIPSQNSYENSV